MIASVAEQTEQRKREERAKRAADPAHYAALAPGDSSVHSLYVAFFDHRLLSFACSTNLSSMR